MPTYGLLANLPEPDDPARIERVFRTADDLGYDYLAFGDHLTWRTLEPWTVLAWAAAITDRIRLTHLVLNNTYRHPCLLAKMGASLDFLSDGRYELGIGAGTSNREEYRPYGLPYYPFRERVARLREALAVVTRLWEEGECDFDGDHFEVEDATLSPTPAQQPRPPVLVGGQSDALSDVAAEYEGWNFGFDLAPAACREHVESFAGRHGRTEADRIRTPVGVLLVVAGTREEVEEAVGRRADRAGLSTEEFLERYVDSFVGTPDEIVEQVNAYREAGIDEFFLWGPSVSDPEALELFASAVIPETS